MLSLTAKIREATGKKTKIIREAGKIAAVLYGPKIKNNSILEVDAKEFGKVFREAGESSLVSLKVEGKKDDNLVLIHDIERDALTGSPIHVDFYQPDLDKEIEAKVPLVFIGEALAVKDFGGTLVKSISEIIVKAKPQALPKELKISIDKLKTLEDVVLIQDLQVPQGVKISRNPKDIVVSVAAAQKIEEELAKPAQEQVEAVEKVGGGGEKKGAEEGEGESKKPKEGSAPAKATAEKKK